jgi:DNA-binding CsgD family transcriptional regulator
VSSGVLADVLIAAGDLAAAEPVCMTALAQAQDAGDLWIQVDLLFQMGLLDVQAGRIDDATAHLHGALQTAVRTGSASLLDTLDGCGHLCAATGRCAEAVTLWAAYAALLPEGYTDPPHYVRRRREPLCKVREALGPARARTAEERGAAMSLDTATEYALMLTAPGQPPPAAPPGPAKLSARERELVTLVARGRTDAQIAEQLFISVRTVRSHLDRIRDKTGCRRRADLTRIALQANLV